MDFFDRIAHEWGNVLHWPHQSLVARYRHLARKIIKQSEQFADDDAVRLLERATELRVSLQSHAYDTSALIYAFALIREAAGRKLGMRHFESQLIGGLILLHGGVAEMATGEGKTLVATLPACAAALAGVSVHVVTVNDYLTQRDAELMRPVYAALGISVASVINDMELPARREAYAQAVTYCTNKELVFDYLKDQILLAERGDYLRMEAQRLSTQDTRTNQIMLRGLHFAIVDEADSILVDEARTPLIISASGTGHQEQEQTLTEAMSLVESLREGLDYVINHEKRTIELKEDGLLHLQELTAELGPFWRGRIRREESIRQALYATYLLLADVHYLVRDGKVQIIDELTGRIMEDRSWEKGLHQMVEIKEGVELTPPRETLARISYQRFFRKYFHLSGMTGTAQEIRSELWKIYALRVIPIPLNRPSRRITVKPTVLPDQQAKWKTVVTRLGKLRAESTAVLVGTQSVGASEELSGHLTQAGIQHRVLNAKQDAEEADIISQAGQAGCITVATSMAGRGTDIKLDPQLQAGKGLHVLLTEHHEASRIDRQLKGRCARQGDPGSYEEIVSLRDYLVRDRRGGWRARLARSAVCQTLGLRNTLGLWALRSSQKRLERVYARMRNELFKNDQKQADMLSFAGRNE